MGWIVTMLQRIPLAVKMAALLLAVGGTGYYALFLKQQIVLHDYFIQQVTTALHDESSEHHQHLGHYAQLISNAVKALANSVPLQRHVVKRAPPGHAHTVTYHQSPPPWQAGGWPERLPIQPVLMVLSDDSGVISEMYAPRAPAPPAEQRAALGQRILTGEPQLEMIDLAGRPYLLSQSPIPAEDGRTLARLGWVIALDKEFLMGALEVISPSMVSLLLSRSSGKVVASTDETLIPIGLPLSSFDRDFLVIAQHPLSFTGEFLLTCLSPRQEVGRRVEELSRMTSQFNISLALVFVVSATLMVGLFSFRVRLLARETMVFSQIFRSDDTIPQRVAGDEINVLRHTLHDLQHRVIQYKSDLAVVQEDLHLRMEISNLLRGDEPLTEQLDRVVETLLTMQELRGVQKGGIFLRPRPEDAEGRDGLALTVLQGQFSPEFMAQEQHIALGECLCGQAALTGQVITTPVCDGNPSHPGRPPMAPHGHYIIPLKHAGVVFGVLFLYTNPVFSTAPERVHTLRLVGEMVGAHIHARKLMDRLAVSNQELSHALAETRTVQQALTVSEQRLATLIASLPVILIQVDEQGVINHWNPAAEKVLGIPRATAMQGSFFDLPLHWPWETVKEALARHITSRKMVELHALPCQRQDGENILLDLAFLHLVDIGRGAFAIMGFDVTRQRHLELQLRHAQKLEAVGTLAAGLAHEINTPIQFIGDNTHFLKESFQDIISLFDFCRQLLDRVVEVDPEVVASVISRESAIELPYIIAEVPRAVDQILEGVNRVSRIIHAMKEFSQPDQGQREAVDINTLIANLLVVAHFEYKEVAEVVTELDPLLPNLFCYRGNLSQSLLNLLINASHAIRDNPARPRETPGTIRIITRQEGHEVVIHIEDTGCGIPEAIRDRIFEPFFTTKRVGEGTGQGLAFAHTVVTRHHGGTLTFTSTVGVGTRFTVRLPLKPVQADEATP